MLTFANVVIDACFNYFQRNKSIAIKDSCEALPIVAKSKNAEDVYATFFENKHDEDAEDVQIWRTKHEVIDREKKLHRMFATDSMISRLPPEDKANKHNSFRPKKYFVPEEVLDSLRNYDLEEHFEFIKNPLTPENYATKLHYLLYFEEAARILEMRCLDLDLRTLERRGEFFSLLVPDSIIGALEVENRVLLTHPTREPRITFEGKICKIVKNFILIRFPEYFCNCYDGTPYNVSFQHGRMRFIFSHTAVDKLVEQLKKSKSVIHHNSEMLFPKEKYSILKGTHLTKDFSEQIQWFQQNLSKRQVNAVLAVLKHTSRPSPYVVDGATGTGKTSTIVECVLQVLSVMKNSRILVCTQSNSHADFIVSRLVELGLSSDDLVRLVFNSYASKISDNLKPYSAVAKKDHNCDLHWLSKRVIVTTSMTAALIHYVISFKTLFTHCFVDESTRMTEPESLIAIGLINIFNGVILLCGDSKLKPFCVSHVARENGLNVSFMSRLMQSAPYAEDESFNACGGYDPKFISKLEANEY